MYMGIKRQLSTGLQSRHSHHAPETRDRNADCTSFLQTNIRGSSAAQTFTIPHVLSSEFVRRMSVRSEWPTMARPCQNLQTPWFSPHCSSNKANLSLCNRRLNFISIGRLLSYWPLGLKKVLWVLFGDITTTFVYWFIVKRVLIVASSV